MSEYPGLIESLAEADDSKIIFFILDGVGGLAVEGRPGTELHCARTPHLDELARSSSCGLLIPVTFGVTPGSGPGHFALFGYDPVECNLGRGVLEAAGIGFRLTERDVAARGNFATVDPQGRIVDRRAGRISTEECRRICQKLQQGIEIPGVEIFVESVKEHRFLVVFRGEGLYGEISDTDPQATGVPPLDPEPLVPEARPTAALVSQFISQAAALLKDEPQANMVTLRGFAKHHPYPSLQERFKLRSLCLANYPMYRGVSLLVGMDLYPITAGLEEQLSALEKSFSEYDFFFLHVKTTDATGEDGDFDAKVAAIEALDRCIPRLLSLHPQVLVITGDHSTPSALRRHSWHPVPVLLHAATARVDTCQRFTELECLKGALGQFPAKHLLPLALAHAGRLQKFGA